MNDRVLFKILVTVFLAFPIKNSTQAAKPNVLFFFTDDQRADAVGALGNPNVKTPYMDRLIRDGFLFDQAYCQGAMTQAVCLPTRSMLLSGKSLFRAPRSLDRGMTLPVAFRKSGYKTFMTGKWHNGAQSLIDGFNEAEKIFLGGASGTHYRVRMNRLKNGQMEPIDSIDRFATDIFSDEVIGFLKRHKKSDPPFFCYVPFTAPHSPFTPPEGFQNLYSPSEIVLPPNIQTGNPRGQAAGSRQRRGRGRGRGPQTRESIQENYALYYAMITNLDHHIGRILNTLKETGQEKNTIVLLANDHGLAMNSHGMGGKANSYEESSKVFISISGPGIPSGQKSSALVYLYDLFPTLCDLTGIPTPNGLEGHSLNGIIHGKEETIREYLFTAYLDTQRSIRDSKYKILHHMKENKVELFDLKSDPHETKDLSLKPELQSKLIELTEALNKAKKEYGDTPERTAELMQSSHPGRGGRGGGGGRPGGRIGSDLLAAQFADKVFASASNDKPEQISSDEFERVWLSWFENWDQDASGILSQSEWTTGVSSLIGNAANTDNARTQARRPQSQRFGSGRFPGPGFRIARILSTAAAVDSTVGWSKETFRNSVDQWFLAWDANKDSKLAQNEIKNQLTQSLNNAPGFRSRGNRPPTTRR